MSHDLEGDSSPSSLCNKFPVALGRSYRDLCFPRTSVSFLLFIVFGVGIALASDNEASHIVCAAALRHPSARLVWMREESGRAGASALSLQSLLA